MSTARMNVRYLGNTVLYSLILPLTIAVLLDLNLGWQPILTIGASLIFIPLASLIVIKATLAEFNRVIEQVAPVELDSKE